MSWYNSNFTKLENDTDDDDVIFYHFLGGFLTGQAIRDAIKDGTVTIEPYDENNINPNSYNLTIGNTCKVLDVNATTNPFNDYHGYIDTTKPIQYKDIEISNDGLLLEPGNLYLIATNETIGSNYYIPMITGRSSMGRMGVSVHQEAGFGDIGYHGKWTLQVTVVKPTMIYPNMKMAQMYMVVPAGRIADLYNGKYQNSTDAAGSQINRDFHR